MTLEGPLVSLRTRTPRPGFNTYGFMQGYGIASVLLFAIVYGRLQRDADPGPD